MYPRHRPGLAGGDGKLPSADTQRCECNLYVSLIQPCIRALIVTASNTPVGGGYASYLRERCESPRTKLALGAESMCEMALALPLTWKSAPNINQARLQCLHDTLYCGKMGKAGGSYGKYLFTSSASSLLHKNSKSDVIKNGCANY